MTELNSAEDILRERWQTIRAELEKRWPLRSDCDLAQADGDLTAIEGLVRQKYGTSREETHANLEELTAYFREDVRGRLRNQYRPF